MEKVLRAQMVENAKAYVVVNDGQFRYPVLRSDMRPGDTEEVVTEMNSDEYAAWCNAVPADLRYADVGTRELIDLCSELESCGADVWNVG